VVVGCGRLGTELAVALANSGYEVTVVDQSQEALNRLPASLPVRRVVGTGIDVDVLRSAGAEGADALCAVTSRDNTNIMLAQVAERLLGVRQVVARVNDPRLRPVFDALGLRTVCPPELAAQEFLRTILASPAEPGPVGSGGGR
jgi:trk system potassium uptake protein TrkA